MRELDKSDFPEVSVQVVKPGATDAGPAPGAWFRTINDGICGGRYYVDGRADDEVVFSWWTELGFHPIRTGGARPQYDAEHMFSREPARNTLSLEDWADIVDTYKLRPMTPEEIAEMLSRWGRNKQPRAVAPKEVNATPVRAGMTDLERLTRIAADIRELTGGDCTEVRAVNAACAMALLERQGATEAVYPYKSGSNIRALTLELDGVRFVAQMDVKP